MATKCNFSPNMSLHGPNCSTELGTYWLADLAPDFWFIGGQSLVEYFFGSLHLRFSNGEQIAHESERSQLVQLAQQHNIDLSNAPCGVLRSHPHAIEGMHFCSTAIAVCRSSWTTGVAAQVRLGRVVATQGGRCATAIRARRGKTGTHCSPPASTPVPLLSC